MEPPTKKSDRVGPGRTCIGCRCSAPADSLIRFALVDGALGASGAQLIQSRTASGRGAWICAQTAHDCFDAAAAKGAFARAFRSRVSTASIEAARVLLIADDA